MTQPKLIDVPGGLYIPAVTIQDTSGGIGPSVGTATSISSSASDVVILAANASRKGAVIYNDSTSVLYVLLASGTSSSSNYSVQLTSQSMLSLRPGEYIGVIKGVWASANGSAKVTEFV